MVVDPAAGTGVAIVGLNNPHIGEDEIAEHKICTPLENHPLMAEIDYPDSIEKGITYACTVEEAAKAISEIPDLGPLGLLE